MASGLWTANSLWLDERGGSFSDLKLARGGRESSVSMRRGWTEDSQCRPASEIIVDNRSWNPKRPPED